MLHKCPALTRAPAAARAPSPRVHCGTKWQSSALHGTPEQPHLMCRREERFRSCRMRSGMLQLLRSPPQSSCLPSGRLRTPHAVLDANRHVSSTHRRAFEATKLAHEAASDNKCGEMSRDCTCRALWVCLQGQRKGLVGLEGEGRHAPAHDWQMTTPCDVLHDDLARGMQHFHGPSASAYACESRKT